MNKRDRQKLQRMIDKTVKRSNAFYEAQEELNNWCLDRYGFEPGDIDADEIIDGVFGAIGLSDGITADQFDAAMTDALEEAPNDKH